jgi:hypothetical protein
MSTRRGILVIIVAGTLWGLSEVFLGDIFYRFHMPMRGASLTAIGIAIMVAARILFNRTGSSLVVALIAGGFRCLVPRMYICHMIAVALEGCIFDVTWSTLKVGARANLRKAWVASIISAYTGFIAFGFVALCLFGFGRWVEGGPGSVLGWTLRSGSFSALLLAGLVPLAVLAARRIQAAEPALDRVAPKPEN